MTHELVITVWPEGLDRQEIFESTHSLPIPAINTKLKLKPNEPLHRVIDVESHIGRDPISGAVSFVTYVTVIRVLKHDEFTPIPECSQSERDTIFAWASRDQEERAHWREAVIQNYGCSNP